MILAFFLTMKNTVGQRKANTNCHCYTAVTHETCNGAGCSRGSNPNCTGASSPDGSDIIFYLTATDGYLGCNCPGYLPAAVLNGFYGTRDNIHDGKTRLHNGIGIVGSGYIYTTCTDFGGDARNSDNRRPGNANDATDCCNYCCGRNDSRPNGSNVGAIVGIIIAIIVVIVVIGGIVWWRFQYRRKYYGHG